MTIAGTAAKLRLKAHLTAAIAGPDTVLIVGEEHSRALRGTAAAAVAAYLDGHHSAQEILTAVATEIPLADAYMALRRFDALGYLSEGAPVEGEIEVLAGWESQGLTGKEARRRLSATPVLVTALGRAASAVDPMLEALRSSGVHARAGTFQKLKASPDTVVVLVDDYLDPQLADVNDQLLALGRPWVLVKPRGLEVWVGPVFNIGGGGCWECLRHRLEGNRPIDQFLRHGFGSTSPLPLAASASSVGLAAQITASVVTSLALTGASAADDTLVSVHTRTIQAEQHLVRRQPHCPACGDPSLARITPRIDLVDAAAPVRSASGWRVMPARATLDRLSKHVDRLLGVVSSLRSTTVDEDETTASYQVVHGFAASHTLDELRRSMRGRSGGKGTTDEQARVSGLCEAVERYAGIWRGDPMERFAAYEELGPEAAVAANSLMLFSERQFAERQQGNSPAARTEKIPLPLSPDQPISWSSAWSLTDDTERLVPAAYAWYGHPELVQGFCLPDSNGNAAGNTLEEAILQGFCELVERDSTALWWYNRVRRPALDLDSIGDPYVARLRESYTRSGRDLWVLDITGDLGIPAFAAVSRRMDEASEDIVLGLGAHLDPRIAATRALTELNQSLPVVAGRNADGSTRYRTDDPIALGWWREASLARNQWLAPDPYMPASRILDYPDLRALSLGDAVRHCVRLASEAGMETLVLNQTRPDIDLHVVKVMVPGLRHFWRRLAPGRLYDVPARLGWRDAPLTEADCNPVGFFF
ncbi:TOMM precursor leader peptide-binding protein [Streptomyces sp. NPDC001833]|uniref:TOMM precursor leader peptide-binding protein n=1 Tax=Streptomyces sp. NPDC001833 TaxID=3154658 RepID=UPI00332DBC57